MGKRIQLLPRYRAALLLVLASATSVFADNYSQISTPGPRDKFYFKVDSAAVFLRPPDKDNSNFAEGVDGPGNTEPANGVSSVGSQSTGDTTWSLGGTMGYYLPLDHPAAWLGQNLRVEVSGNYLQSSDIENSNISIGPSGTFENVGRLDGNYTGTNSSTDIGSTTGGPNPVAQQGLATKDQLYQVGTAIRSDYLFNHGQVVLSPRYGFQYSHLDQNFHTYATGNRGTVDQHEDVTTDYYGPTFGLELKVQLTKELVYYAEGDISPLYATSDYSGTQNGSSTRFGGGSGMNSASDSHDQFTFKAGFTTGVYCDLGPVIIKAGGGFDYWNYVATVQESSVPAGTDSISTFVPAPPVPAIAAHGPFTVAPSHLIGSDMLNPTIKLSVIVPF